MTSLTKSFSVQLKRKPNSHTKLPKLPITSDPTDNKIISNEFESLSKNVPSGNPASHMLSLYSKRGSSMNGKEGSKTIKILTQENEVLESRKKNNSSIIKLKPIATKQEPFNQLKLNKDSKHKILIQTTGATDSKTESAGSSRASLHPVVNQIQNLISEETSKLILPVKSYQQNAIGQISSIWWCVVDSLFISLGKILKVKKTETSPEKEMKIEKLKEKQGPKGQKQSPSKGQKSRRESPEKNSKKISGAVESNTKASIQMSRVYSQLEEQTQKNQQQILKCYQDPNHTALILQSLFYEKAVMYLLGTIRKWNHHQEHLYIHSLAIELLPCIIECRRLMMDILMEAVENQQQDNKIRKPKYIAREKKLIQISKFTTMMKSEYEKYLNGLGSPHRYRNFAFPDPLREHVVLFVLERKWRNIVFDVPMPPFIVEKANRKQYLIVIEPLNLLYKYNKKQESLQIDPYAQFFLKKLGETFDIVLFTHADKQSSLLNFLGVLDRAQINSVLDRHHLTHRQAKTIKDIVKIGGGYPKSKILVLDEKANSRFYLGCQHAVMLVDGNTPETKIARIGGKLVRTDEHDEDYLRNLASKIVGCGDKGGHWEEIIHDPHQRRK